MRHEPLEAYRLDTNHSKSVLAGKPTNSRDHPSTVATTKNPKPMTKITAVRQWSIGRK